MGFLEGTLILVGGALIVVTLLPFSSATVWWVRVWEFPRLQLAGLTLLVLLIYAFTQTPFASLDLLFMGALVLCLLYHGTRIVPYTPFVKTQVQVSRHPQTETMLRLFFVNVEMPNREAGRLQEIIRAADADIILTVETDAWWQKQLQQFAATHPHTVWHPQENYYGMMLFSRLELVDPEIKFLVKDDIPSIHTQVRLRDGRGVHLHCLHPRPPVPNDKLGHSTERDAELSILGRQLEKVDIPTIVLGDLNDVAWSHTTHLFSRISSLLDPRVGRGFYNSFHARYPIVRFPLDHLFHSNHFRLVEFERLPAFGSDHFPMLVTLNLEPEAKKEQQAEPATAEDKAEAEEKIEEAEGNNTE